jgi:hypothetical protein
VSRSRRALFACAALAFAACQRGEGDARLDRVTLHARLDADIHVVELLAQADALALRGKADDARKMVDETILPLAKENATLAKSLAPVTAWGKARLSAALDLTAERERSVSAYREALASDDVERVIAAMEAEKPIDERAQKLQTDLDAPLPAPTGC